jgi:hypothetical protein
MSESNTIIPFRRKGSTYDEIVREMSPDAQYLLSATWATLAKRFMPDLPEAEAIAGFKKLHAAALIEIIYDDGVADLRVTKRLLQRLIG